MKGLRELHLFAGAGGGILGGMLLGHTCVCAVEIEPYRRKVLLQRQRDGILPKFPIWDDVRTFDGGPWKGIVDAICAGIPCQRVSAAGIGGGFIEQDYYIAFRRIVYEVGPSIVFLENSPLLTSRGIGCVLWDLAKMGFNAKWGVLGVSDARGPHKRKRIWVVAYSTSLRWSEVSERFITKIYSRNVETEFPKKMLDTNPNSNRLQRFPIVDKSGATREQLKARGETSRVVIQNPWRECRNEDAPRVLGVAHGVANRVDRLKAIGDGQVPAVVRLAWSVLSGE